MIKPHKADLEQEMEKCQEEKKMGKEVLKQNGGEPSVTAWMGKYEKRIMEGLFALVLVFESHVFSNKIRN